MRTSLPDNRQTTDMAVENHESSRQMPFPRLPIRSGSNLGETERIDQTFLIMDRLLQRNKPIRP